MFSTFERNVVWKGGVQDDKPDSLSFYARILDRARDLYAHMVTQTPFRVNTSASEPHGALCRDLVLLSLYNGPECTPDIL